MCGRFTATCEFSDIWVRWNLDHDLPKYTPRFNVAPETSPNVPLIVRQRGGNECRLMHWGLIPHWAADPSIVNRMINARAETLTELPSFKSLVNRGRCIIPADGFYEWRKEGKGKIPMRFKLKSGKPFAFAGLWDSWKQPDGSLLRTYTIVTTEPNDVLRPIHNRMPVMLSNDDAQKWLADDDEIAHVLTLLKPYPPGEMEGYGVSPVVSNPRNDSPECILPVEG